MFNIPSLKTRSLIFFRIAINIDNIGFVSRRPARQRSAVWKLMNVRMLAPAGKLAGARGLPAAARWALEAVRAPGALQSSRAV